MKINFHKIISSKEAKTLFGNFASLLILQGVNIILPLITLPYLLRVLGAENYGKVILAASTVLFFHSLTDYSFKITATRDVAIFRDNVLKLNFIFSKVMIVKGLFAILSFLILSLVVYLYPPFYEERLTFFLTFPMLLGHVLFPDWFFQGIEKMKYITILNVGVKICFTIGIFVFIQNQNDYWLYPLLNSAGYVISGLIAQVILFRKFNLTFFLLNLRLIQNTISDNFAIFINQFLPNLYNNTTTFLLGVLVGTGAVGTYDAIKKIVDLCVTLIGISSRVWFPFLNRNLSFFNKYKTWSIISSILLTVLVISLHPIIVWYLNINFNNSLLAFVCLSVGIIGFAFYDVYGVNYLIVRREDSVVMKNTLIASIAGFILAFPLISYYEIIGAAINLTLARWIMGFGLLLKVKKLQRTRAYLIN